MFLLLFLFGRKPPSSHLIFKSNSNTSFPTSFRAKVKVRLWKYTSVKKMGTCSFGNCFGLWTILLWKSTSKKSGMTAKSKWRLRMATRTTEYVLTFTTSKVINSIFIIFPPLSSSTFAVFWLCHFPFIPFFIFSKSKTVNEWALFCSLTRLSYSNYCSSIVHKNWTKQPKWQYLLGNASGNAAYQNKTNSVQ